MPGVYGPIVTKTSGTAVARIRYVSQERWGARIVSNGSAYAWTNDGDHVDIIGFDLSGATAIGVNNRGSGVSVVGNYIHDIGRSVCESGGGIDHSEYSAADNKSFGNLIVRIGPNDGSICNQIHGVYHANRGGIVANNIIVQAAGYGVHLWHAATAVVVANNSIVGSGYGGIVVGAGGSPGGIVNNESYVVNNIVAFNRHVGIRESGSTGAQNEYVRNLVFENKKDFMLSSGVQKLSITANPQFIDYQPDGRGDYRLRPASPGVDAGIVVREVPVDFDGYRRPYGDKYDIGAYEWHPSSPVPGTGDGLTR